MSFLDSIFGGSSEQTTQTRSFDPEIKPFILGEGGLLPAGQNAMQRVQNQFANTNVPLTAGFNSNQQAGLDQAVQLGLNTLQGQFLDPNAAFIQDQISAALNPIQDRLQQQILPELSSQAIQQGAFGGSRDALLNAQALMDFNRAAGETSANIVGSNIARERGLQQNALQQLINPAIATDLGVQQAAIDAEINRPFLGLPQFASLIGPSLSGQTNVTTTSPGSSALGGMLQGGLGGAALAHSMGWSGPWGAILGGLAGAQR